MRPLAMIVDVCIVVNAYTLASLVLFARWAPVKYYSELLIFIPLAISVHLALNSRLGLYRSVDRYAGIHQGLCLARAALISAPVLLLSGVIAMPSSFLHVVAMVPIGGVIAFIFMSVVRFYPRIFYERSLRHVKPQLNMLVVGAGVAGAMIVSAIQKERKLAINIVGLVDDDAGLAGLEIHGVRIHGATDLIGRLVREKDVDEILIAIPSAPLPEFQRIFALCSQTDAVTKTVRPLQSMHAGRVGLEQVRDIEIEDVLGRQPVETDHSTIRDFIRGKVVLVTGAGGSIGSELATQISYHNPQLLILTDRDESALYDIHEKLSQNLMLNHEVCVLDVQLKDAVESVFRRYRPQLVFHAAAYKHVPLMELQPEEAVLNNVKGTWVMAHLAGVYGARGFVNISTDKAVDPVNVMGATKQLGEQVVGELGHLYAGTCYCSVRFGNVLDSRGSVIPIFREQIRNGGPVTITHPEMTRYFMLISEAVDLVLQAAAFEHGNAVYVLEMGEPVKITDLAAQMISFLGSETPIDVVYTGLRPGEKLHEQLLCESEARQSSPHPMIYCVERTAEARAGILGHLPLLFQSAMDRDPEALTEMMKKLTNSYSPFDMRLVGQLQESGKTRSADVKELVRPGTSYSWGTAAGGQKTADGRT